MTGLQDSTFLRACRGEKTPHTPVWLYRQAGRYMPEYHALKGNTPSLDFFKTPHMAAQATCDAQRILGVDAAILFADLLPIVEPMGLRLDYLPGVGPKIDNPVRTNADIDAIMVQPAVEQMPYIEEAITLINRELPDGIPLIGFTGAPFTLASYAIEGQGSKNYVHAKRMMHSDSGAWHALLEKITDCVIDYGRYQIESGVSALQLFDSWVGTLSPADYSEYVMPHTMRAFRELSTTGGAGHPVPLIHFGTGNPALLPLMAEAGGDVLGVDWRADLMTVWDKTGATAVQGNLDPIILCSSVSAIESAAGKILSEVDGRPGHVFNLGHGIIPETPVDNVRRLVSLVHERTDRR